ncbi:MAG: Na/Pi symporter [Myxococcota bacterium]
MNTQQWLEAASGLGIFLFSIKILTQTLQLSMMERFHAILRKLTATSPRGLFTGFSTTVMMQASSACIIATMGFVDASFMTVEQGFFVMLGATLGTTVKAWIFGATLLATVPPLFLMIGALLLLFITNPRLQRFLEFLLAVMLLFLGLQLLAKGLSPLKDDPILINMLQLSTVKTLSEQLLAIFLGFLCTLVLQSSSAALFLIFSLATQGQISPTVSAALILGANIGTTSTALIASFAFQRPGRKIALAHFFVKFFGVFLVLFFFQNFYDMLAFTWFRVGVTSVPLLLAGFHTGFNLLNVLLWSLLSPLILWLLHWIAPNPTQEHTYTLSPAVWRVLVSSPRRALREVREQNRQTLLLLKEISETCLYNLTQPFSAQQQSQLPLTTKYIKRFQPLQEGTSYLLLRCSPNTLSEDDKHFVHTQIRHVEAYQRIFQLQLEWLRHLHRRNPQSLPEIWLPLLQDIRQQLHTLWNATLLEQEQDEQLLHIHQTLSALEQAKQNHWQKFHDHRYQDMLWRFDLIHLLHSVFQRLEELYLQTTGNLRPQQHAPTPKTQQTPNARNGKLRPHPSLPPKQRIHYKRRPIHRPHKKP